MIPATWQEVTLENFYPLERTLKEEPKDEVEKHDLLVKRACFISDMEVEEVQELTMNELLVVDKLLRTPLPTKLNLSFKLNGRLYVVKLDPTKWDAWRYKAVMNECRNIGSDNLHKLMFLVSVEIKNRFSTKEIKCPPEEVEERMEEFKQLSVALANPLVVFFYNLSNDLTENILSFSEAQMKKMKMTLNQETDYLKNSDGL
jgi:hypothetical protein